MRSIIVVLPFVVVVILGAATWPHSAELVKEGGTFALLAVVVALLSSIALAGLGYVARSRAPAASLAGTLMLVAPWLLGLVGMQLTHVMILEAIANAAPDMRVTLAVGGHAEGLSARVLGASATAALALAWVVVLAPAALRADGVVPRVALVAAAAVGVAAGASAWAAVSARELLQALLMVAPDDRAAIMRHGVDGSAVIARGAGVLALVAGVGLPWLWSPPRAARVVATAALVLAALALVAEVRLEAGLASWVERFVAGG